MEQQDQRVLMALQVRKARQEMMELQVLPVLLVVQV